MTRRRKRADIAYDDAMDLVLREYHNFLAGGGTDTPLEPKDFLARHNAARGALNHLEHLQKLAGPDDSEAGAARLALLQQARAELGAAEAADAGDE